MKTGLLLATGIAIAFVQSCEVHGLWAWVCAIFEVIIVFNLASVFVVLASRFRYVGIRRMWALCARKLNKSQ
jgi:hypothetical protein